MHTFLFLHHHVSRIFRNMYADDSMTINMAGISKICKALDRVSTTLIQRTIASTHSTPISSSDMVAAIEKTMPGDLAQEVTLAVNASFKELKNGDSTGGLEISADRIKTEAMSQNIVLSRHASLVLASALEYLAVEILTLAVSAAAARGKKDINSSDVRTVFDADADIRDLLNAKKRVPIMYLEEEGVAATPTAIPLIDTESKWENFLASHDADIIQKLSETYRGNTEDFSRHFSSENCVKDIQRIDALLAEITFPVEFNMNFQTVCRIFRERYSREFPHVSAKLNARMNARLNARTSDGFFDAMQHPASTKLEMARKELRDKLDARISARTGTITGTDDDFFDAVESTKLEMARKELRDKLDARINARTGISSVISDDVLFETRTPTTPIELPGMNADDSHDELFDAMKAPPAPRRGFFKTAVDGITELFRNPTPNTPPGIVEL